MSSVVGNCKLCGELKPLCRSHILPKSFTRRLRNGASQIIWEKIGLPPKALKANGEFAEPLLCECCEGLIKRNYEDYGTRLFVDKQHIIESADHIAITEFDYEKYFLFVISILWRGSVSSLEIYDSLKPAAYGDEPLKYCLLENTLRAPPPVSVRLDSFSKIAVKKVVDRTLEIPQESIDQAILIPTLTRCESAEKAMHFYFMVDGFFVSMMLVSPDSTDLAGWRPHGHLFDGPIQEIPKVPLYEIKQFCELIVAANSSTNPFISG